MAIQTPPAVIAQAQLDVLVGRDGPGDLVAGVRRLLERAPGVEAADELDVRNVRPGLNDVRLDVTARLRVHPDDLDGPVDAEAVDLAATVDDDALAAQLQEGFGIREATVQRVDPPD